MLQEVTHPNSRSEYEKWLDNFMSINNTQSQASNDWREQTSCTTSSAAGTRNGFSLSAGCAQLPKSALLSLSAEGRIEVFRALTIANHQVPALSGSQGDELWWSQGPALSSLGFGVQCCLCTRPDMHVFINRHIHRRQNKQAHTFFPYLIRQ